MRATLSTVAAYDALADFYDEVIPDPVGFADYYLGTCPGGEVLYVGCGTGRLLAAIAAAGCRCVGIDPSARMLARARERVRAAGLADRVDLRSGTAQEVSLGRSFDRIVLAGGTFEHLLDTREQLRALRRLAAHLRPTGSLHLDIAAPPHLIADRHGSYRGEFDPRLGPRPRLEPSWSRVQLGIDHHRQLVRTRCCFAPAGRPEPVELTFLTRYTTAAELRLLARVAGLRARVYGDFSRGPVRRESRQYVAELTVPDLR